MTPAETIADIRARLSLSTADVARFCRVYPSTARRWLMSPETPSFREAPEWAAVLLALQVGEKIPEHTKYFKGKNTGTL